MTGLHLAWAELRRWLRGSPIRPAALIALALIPTLYGCVYLWSNWDPYGRVDEVPAALVNEDRPVAVNGRTLDAGTRLRAELFKRHDLKWSAVRADGAAEGLKNGDFLVTLTIPRDFSADLASVSGSSPRQARLTFRLDNAHGYIVSKLTEAAVGELRAAVDSAAFTQYAKAALTQQAQAQAQAKGATGSALQQAVAAQQSAIDAQAAAIGRGVKIDTVTHHPARVYGRGLAPFFFSIALWVFGLVVYEIVRPLNLRALSARTRPWAVAIGGWAPAALIGVVGAVVLYVVADAGLGLGAEHLWATLGLLALAAAAFTAVGQVCRALWGVAGALVMLVLLMFQLVSCGGLYPIQTEPAPFRAIHPFCPMTYLVNGLRVTLTGGRTSELWRDVAVLACLLAAFWIIAAAVAAVQRTWSAKRLRPALHA
ncbi:hypothetical protein BIV57_18665 [Mangrovactinospora gilvigrisea]|uniref:ABC-2 type transporter transmembrane domain-containing protein n=1 Tax=Mangrovactinospora gilvigrisea TaxID=1428644 RepID=A0A1J7BBE1_9ACTN|nr:YhgE/Pip family protein [Mangrovactinospora gilvigrisea]OIV35999.1 hypothetical protein BIV57_18665 [Mangrovactinospora gilvigrisea]